MSRKRGAAGPAAQRSGVVDPESSPKLHGVITDQMVDEHVERAGVYPFTFGSSLIIMVAGIVGGMVVPAIAESAGIDSRPYAVLALSVLVALALALTRYFVDSRRGICRGFWVTLVISLVALLVVMWLLLYRGVAF